MELKSFVRVPLKAGERRTVALPLKNLEIYNPETRKTVVENGIYEIYVAGSSAHIHMTVTVRITGGKLRKQNFRLSDYLHTVSDIRSNRYVMEGFCEPMKKRAVLKTLGALLILLTLFADVLYATCVMLNFFDMSSSLVTVALASLIGAGLGMILLFIYHKIHARDMKKQAELEHEATRALFADVESAKSR